MVFPINKSILALCSIISLLPVKLGAQQLTYSQRPRIGLVLGGGGAKGAAAIGALKAVEKSGLPIDYIVGTSAGAIIGGLYSVGYSAKQLDSLYRAQDWAILLSDRVVSDGRHRLVERRDSSTLILGYPTRKHDDAPGLLKADSLVAKLEELIPYKGEISFDSLPIPYRCVSVDIHEFQEIVIAHGNLPRAIRASMSVPVAFRPVKHDGMTLVDGGLLNNLPVDVARAMGADIIIAIDLSTDSRHIAIKGGRKIRSHGIPALLAWKVARPDLMKYQENSADADIYIHPDLQGFSATSFRIEETEEMIRRGEAAGAAAMTDLLKLKIWLKTLPIKSDAKSSNSKK